MYRHPFRFFFDPSRLTKTGYVFRSPFTLLYLISFIIYLPVNLALSLPLLLITHAPSAQTDQHSTIVPVLP